MEVPDQLVREIVRAMRQARVGSTVGQSQILTRSLQLLELILIAHDTPDEPSPVYYPARARGRLLN